MFLGLKMSVISCRDARPVSRATEASSRPIFLLERCLAIRFERVQQQQQQQNQKLEPKKERPGSSLSQLSQWFPWASSKINATSSLTLTSTNADVNDDKQSDAKSSLAPDSSGSPAGWIYDGGFVLFQVSAFHAGTRVDLHTIEITGRGGRPESDSLSV